MREDVRDDTGRSVREEMLGGERRRKIRMG